MLSITPLMRILVAAARTFPARRPTSLRKPGTTSARRIRRNHPTCRPVRQRQVGQREGSVA